MWAYLKSVFRPARSWVLPVLVGTYQSPSQRYIRSLRSSLTDWNESDSAIERAETKIARQAKNSIEIGHVNSKNLVSQSRRDMKRLTDVLTGHCSLKGYLYIIGLSETQHCELCIANERLLGNFTISLSTCRLVLKNLSW